MGRKHDVLGEGWLVGAKDGETQRRMGSQGDTNEWFQTMCDTYARLAIILPDLPSFSQIATRLHRHFG